MKLTDGWGWTAASPALGLGRHGRCMGTEHGVVRRGGVGDGGDLQLALIGSGEVI